MPDEIIADFEREFDAKVVVDNFASNEEMFAKLIGGVSGYDLVVPAQDYAEIMIKQGMLEKIDHAKIPNLKNLSETVREKMVFDPNLDYCIPYFMGGTGICVNKTKVKDYARDWSIFGDSRYKGRMVMMDDRREIIGCALCHLGYSVNSVDDTQLQEAFELIENEWKPNLAKFDSEGFGKSFANGDFWIAQGFSEVVYAEYPEEKWDDIDFFVPESGGPAYLDSFCVLKNAPHYDLALEFINFFHRPENYAKFLDYFRFPPLANPAAAPFMQYSPLFTAETVKNSTLKAELGYDLQKYDKLWEKIRH